MKKIAVILLFLIIACSKVTDKKLIGKWKPVNIDISNNILKTYPAQKINEIEEKILSGYWVFKDNFNFETVYSDSLIVRGEWTLSADGKKLLTKNQNQSLYTEIKIMRLDEENLVTEEEGGTKIYYKKLK